MTSSRQISVLHVIDKLSMDGVNPSSCAILLSDWISHLNANGFSTSVCTLKKTDPGGGFLEKKGVKVHYLGFGKVSFRNIIAIADLIDREKSDIVHLHGYSSANFGRIAARRKGVINIVHEHAVLQVLPHQYLADVILRNFTDAAVAVSETVKDFMISGRCIPAGKISVIPNGIDTDKFKKADESVIKMKRLELGISEGFRVVGTVTRLREEKGVEYFIRAMPHILKEFSSVIFLIIGDGSLREKLEDLARGLTLSSYVRFLGFRNNVVDFLSILDINVIPSLTEGFALSLVEAMSVGNAIVATEVGGMKEIAVHGENILFVPPRNPIEIAEKVTFLLKEPSYAATLSEAGSKASKKFSIQTNVHSLAELYMNLLKPGHLVS